MKIVARDFAARVWRLAAGTELRRNVLETYGARIFVVAITFATAVVIARDLGPAGRGLYAVALALGAIGVQFGGLGLNSSNVYFVAKDKSLLPALLGNSLGVALIACLVAAFVGIGFALWPKLAPVGGGLLILALVYIPVGIGYLLTQGLLLGVNEVRAYNKIECGCKFLALALIGLFAILHRGTVELYFGITLACLLISFLWSLFPLRKVSIQAPEFSFKVFRQCLNIGIKAYLILFFGFLVLRIDLLMVKYMLGATQAGYYSISQVLAQNTMMFPVVIGLILFPKLSAIADRGGKLRITNKAVLVTGALMLPAVLIAALAAGPTISFAFGRNYLPAVSPFVWLMPGAFFLGLETVLVQLLNSEGFPPIIIIAWIVDTIVNVALNFWAIPRYGIVGASVVASACYFLIFVMVAAVVWKHYYAAQSVPACAPDLQPM
jgi:stage V sporulation protein B